MVEVTLPSQEEFEAWLTERANEVVGKANHKCDCPYAEFIKQHLGADQVHVYGSRVSVSLPGIGYRTFRDCNWVDSFVNILDGPEDDNSQPEVTGQQCLDVLKSL